MKGAFLTLLLAGSMLIAVGASPQPQSSAPTTPAAQSGVVQVGQAQIEYFSQGAGQTIVLLPSGGLDVGYMQGVADSLSTAGFRVVSVNFRGAGKSAGPADGVTLHTLAADVAGVVDALKLAPVHVAGHAFGNRVARTLAADRPDLVASVILIAAGGKVAGTAEAQQAVKVVFTPGSSDADMLREMRYLVGDPADSERVLRVINAYRAPQAGAIQARATQATPLAAWWAPSGQARYLALQGAKDLFAPTENGVLLKQELGDRVTLVEIPAAGHMLLVEQPDKVAAAIGEFLRKK